MSWLYTLIFAGLLISDNNEPNGAQLPLLQSETVVSQDVGDVTEKFEQTYPLNKNGRVSLSNVNGSVTVEGWDRNEIKVEATKVAESPESLSQIEIVVNARPDHIQIETEYKAWNNHGENDRKNRRSEVQYRLMVPRGAVLNEIETVNGSAVVSNLVNFTKVSAVNGNVLAANTRGTLKLSTVNGEVKTSFDSLEPGSSISLETVNGRVNLELPSDANATLRADSMNGTVVNEFGLPIKKGRYFGRSLHGRLGTGETPVQLDSVNGSLTITKRKDGRTPSPVTNLLKPGNADDEDDDADSEDESNVEARKIKTSVKNAVRVSDKAVQKGLNEAQKELKNIAPELEKLAVPDAKDLQVILRNANIQRAVVTGERRRSAEAARASLSMWNSAATSVDQKTNSFVVKGTPKVTVNAPQCKVMVRGWDQPTVKYVLSETRKTPQSSMNVIEDAKEKSVSLRIEKAGGAASNSDHWETENMIRLEVYVPRKTDLDVYSEKEIRLHGVSGHLKISGADEPVSVRDSEGDLKLTTADGLIRVVGFKGDLELETADSDVYLEGDFAKIDSKAVDGNITLTLPPTKNASISTNAAIESEGLNIVRENGRTWRLGSGGPKYEFEFADGTLKLRSLSLIETN